MKIAKVVLIGVAVYAALVLACLAVQKTVTAFGSTPNAVTRRQQVKPKGGKLKMYNQTGMVLFLR